MKGLPRSLSRGGSQLQVVRRQLIKVVDKEITVHATTTAVGFGTGIIGDFPQGNILLLGAAAYMAFAGSGADANLTADWEGDFAIGSTPTADVTLGGTDVDIIASTAIGPATAEAIARVRAVNAGQSILDNTDGAMEINLNLLIDAADITDDQDVVITVNGELYVVYSVLGDD